MNLIKKIVLLSVAVAFASAAQAQVKTIMVTPDNAKIYVNGMEVGNGTYSYKFKKSEDFVVLKFEAPGYIPKKGIRLMRVDPRKTVAYTLFEDDAEKNSVGEMEGYDYANKWFSVVAKADMDDETLWKRLMSIAINNFENVEVRDKAAGWIRSGWAKTSFPYQTVRSRLEIKIQFTGENERSFRCRIQSQIADNDCGGRDNCFVPYNRLMKRYESVISELQTTIGSNF